MPIDTVTYAIADEALGTAEKSIANARQWIKNTTYEFGQTCIFGNSFYQANYSHYSGAYFDYSAWTKINNDADKLKGYIIDTTNKGDKKALVFNATENKIEFGNAMADIELDTDIGLTANSDEKISSQKAIKSYVDGKFNTTVTGMTYKGTIDITLGKLPSNIQIGDFYKVLGSNTVDEIQLNTGDMIIANKYNSGETDISYWDIIDNTEAEDILRDKDISTNLDFSIDTGKLTDRGTIKNYIENINGSKELQTIDKTIKGAINEVFHSGVDVKENMVTALTSKGANVTMDSTWSEIYESIYLIQGSGTTSNIQRVTKLNVEGSLSNPYEKIMTLNNPIKQKEVLTCVREFVASEDENNLISDFNADDGEHFQYDKNKIVFDGVLHQKRDILKPMILQRDLGTKDEYGVLINKSEYKTIDGFNIDDLNGYNLALNVTHEPQVIIANGDIDLENVNKIKQIIFNCISSNGGKCLLAMSVDEGLTYHAYNLGTSSWSQIDITNVLDFKSKGMTKTITDALGEIELEALRNGSNTLRFAYYIELVDGSSEAKVDSLSMSVSMLGRQELANKNDYDIVLDNINNTVTFKIYKNGTFSMSATN